jgi:hypothetical protein
MKPDSTLDSREARTDSATVDVERVMREVVRAIRTVNFGSVEIVIHNSRVVQIERKEKLRFDRL